MGELVEEDGDEEADDPDDADDGAEVDDEGEPSSAAMTSAVQWTLTVAPTARPTGSDNLSITISGKCTGFAKLADDGEHDDEGGSDVRVDGERLWEPSSSPSARSGRSMDRPASSAAPASPSPTRTGWAATSSPGGCADLGLTVMIDAIGNVVATRAGTEPDAAAGDDRLAHRHRRHRRQVRRQPRGARRARGDRDAGVARHLARGTRSASPSSPTRKAPASPRTCSAASSTSAAWPSRRRST